METNKSSVDVFHPNVTEKSLADQLQINDREIAIRKSLLGIGPVDEEILKNHRELVVEKVDLIVEEFYAHQTGNPEIQVLIGDAESLQRLRAAMRRYIVELFDGFYDGNYVNKRLRIGKVHKRIGVSPKLYVSAIHLLETLLYKHLASPGKTKKEPQTTEPLRAAIRRMVMFDLQLVFDTYINSLVTEVEAAKFQVEEYARSLESTVELRTQQLKELSIRDTLTGLGNQRDFQDQLRRAISNCERHQQPLTLLYFDLNGFKALNDREGHRAGDTVLELVGKVVRKVIRGHDSAARYGGDEFCVIMQNSDLEQAFAVSDRLIENFKKEKNAGVSFSIGIAVTGPESFLGSDQLIRLADDNMYKAKAKSRKKPGYYIHPTAEGKHATTGKKPVTKTRTK